MRSFKWQYLCAALVLSACGGSSSEGDSAVQDTVPVVAESLTETTILTDDESTEAQETREPLEVEETAPVSQPELISGEEMLEICPSPEEVSTTTGVEFPGDQAQALQSASDPLGADPTTGSVTCSYQTLESDLLIVLHGSPVDTSLFRDLPDTEANELASGALQLQFEGQPSCEIYDGQTSAIFFTASDSDSLCDIALAAIEAAQ